MRAHMVTPLALMALCLSSSVYCFADEPTCSYGEDGKPDTCSFESGDLYEVCGREQQCVALYVASSAVPGKTFAAVCVVPIIVRAEMCSL